MKTWMQMTPNQRKEEVNRRISLILEPAQQPQAMSLMDRLSMGKEAMNSLKGAMNGQTKTASKATVPNRGGQPGGMPQRDTMPRRQGGSPPLAKGQSPYAR